MFLASVDNTKNIEYNKQCLFQSLFNSISFKAATLQFERLVVNLT